MLIMLLIQAILIFVKVMGYVSWSWWLVFTPVWFFVVAGIVAYFLSK